MKLRLTLLVFLAVFLTACNFSLAEDTTPPPNYVPPTAMPTLGPLFPAEAPDIENGAAIYAEKCVDCHGPQGMGDGEQGKQLPVTVATSRWFKNDPFPRDTQENTRQVMAELMQEDGEQVCEKGCSHEETSGFEKREAAGRMSSHFLSHYCAVSIRGSSPESVITPTENRRIHARSR